MKLVNILELLAQSASGEFKRVMPFNDGFLEAIDIQGTSPMWEMHPDTDELFYVLDGLLKLELLGDDESEFYAANRNELFVIPKGRWHKFSAPTGAKFFYLTPGQVLHSDKADPRI